MRISPEDIQLANTALGVEDAITLARAHRIHAPNSTSRFPRALLDTLAKQKKVKFIGRAGVAFVSEAVAAEAIRDWYRTLFAQEQGGGTDAAGGGKGRACA